MAERVSYVELFEKLYRFYGPQGWWPAASDFQMLISAILVQRTNWKNVELALENLGEDITAVDLMQMEEAELAEKIRPSGFYRMKAKKIINWLHWFQQYEFNIENVRQLGQAALRNELLEIHGVGEETADAMMLYAFDKPGFIADNYARRLFICIGYDIPKTYHAFKTQVEAAFPDDLEMYQEFHALIVQHGKQYCKKEPLCKGCPLISYCRVGSQKIDDLRMQ
ncbi:endonuclease III domain-containing protein [Oceanobacillus sp. J11TS1]|uniref:endonuclease III domain-containing protein n=1 Tax=Oceanobacillus sp. J11TS1 TaxID=2807191 RepID=UPI001B04DCE8|nr:endonuclease III domain-containing protein [Oceanobacillus sp. J11TS1]GIO21548.1 endonuclease III [Oceanobacillus sp. J11TS1]